MSELLSIMNIDAGYDDLVILKNISLSIRDKEIVAILGSNGAGKTTLLKTIVGIVQPKKGHILFLGRQVNKLSTYERIKMGIGYVPSEGGVFPLMTVLENLEMGYYVVNKKGDILDRLDYVFSLFSVLKERRNQIAGTLSGGEQRMLSIGRALMSSPRLLLLDEPSFGLAPRIVKELFNAIRQINEEGTAILLVEQNVRLALEIANRAYVLENGSIVLDGSSADIATNPLVKKAYLGI